MKTTARELYNKGYNCCEAVIMAADSKYNLKIPKDSLKFASGLNNGIGVGSLCGGVIGGIMVLGYIFETRYAPEHSNINHIRMKFVDSVNSKFNSLNCAKISTLPIAEQDCSEVVDIITDVLEKTINQFI